MHDLYNVIFVLCVYMLGKVTALGVLCCLALFVCLTLLASFFLPSHLSFKNMYFFVLCMYMYIHVYTCIYLVPVCISGELSYTLLCVNREAV